MDTKKDIGQFFKYNLNQMDFTPNNEGWNKIEEELNQKKKKRRGFFWLFLTAFLAGSIFTLLLVYSTNWMNSDFNNQKNSNATENNSNTSVSSNLNTKNSKSNNQNFINNSNNNIVNSTKESTSANNNQKNNNSENIELKNKSISNRDRVNNIFKNNNSNSIKKNSKKNSKKNFTNDAFKFETNTNSKLLAQKNKKQSKKKNNNSINGISIITDLNDSSAKDIVGTNIAQTESEIDTVKTIIELQETKDTLAIAATSKNKKLEPKKEKDSTEVKAKEKTNSFIISPYYGTGLFPKNQVKGNFNSNNLVASKNEQYGVIFRWMTSQHYGLQIGIGYINTSTQTEIEKNNSNTLVVNDVNNNSGVTFPSTNKLMMHHNLSMYEIPLEFYYKLSDKKIGFALSSGISHTIIKDNSVSIETADETIKIGSLESLTKSNFTANFKFYSHYKFSDKLQFEVYPSFQYQFLNTIKSKELNSTIFSIRAGIAYRF